MPNGVARTLSQDVCPKSTMRDGIKHNTKINARRAGERKYESICILKAGSLGMNVAFNVWKENVAAAEEEADPSSLAMSLLKPHPRPIFLVLSAFP